jgi:hypothetical protein
VLSWRFMRQLRVTLGLLSIAAVLIAAPACSFKRMGVERMADAISATASTYSRDNDPEFVRLAAPSTLKMVEMLLDESPTHPGLLMTACSGFTQYAYAFLQADAEAITPASAAREPWARTVRMYDRGRDYCLRLLDHAVPGARVALLAGDSAVLAKADRSAVPALYWAAASWGGSTASSPIPLFRVGEVRTVRALMERALAIDPQWEAGAIHEGMIAIEGLPSLAGGSAKRARDHFDRAIALSGGQSAFAYLTMATSVAQPARDRSEFERLLKSALAVDVNKRPTMRLANLIAQRRAAVLLARTPQLF